MEIMLGRKDENYVNKRLLNHEIQHDKIMLLNLMNAKVLTIN